MVLHLISDWTTANPGCQLFFKCLRTLFAYPACMYRLLVACAGDDYDYPKNPRIEKFSVILKAVISKFKIGFCGLANSKICKH